MGGGACGIRCGAAASPALWGWRLPPFPARLTLRLFVSLPRVPATPLDPVIRSVSRVLLGKQHQVRLADGSYDSESYRRLCYDVYEFVPRQPGSAEPARNVPLAADLPESIRR